MPDVEFLSGDGPDRDADTDEELDTAPRRRWWVPVLAAVVLAAIVVTLVLTHGGSSTPSSAPSSAPVPSLPVPSDDGPPAGLLVDLIADAPDHRVLAVFGSRLLAVDARGRQLDGGATLAVHSPDDDVALSFDPTRDLVWAVREGLPIANPLNPGSAQGFSARTLAPVGRAVLPAPVQSSAALDGSLYVLAYGRLYRLSEHSRQFRLVARPGVDAQVLITDPSRHRLLIGEAGSQERLARWSPKDGLGRPVTLPLAQGEVVVADGRIWAGGSTRGGANVLTRLDPGTLRAGRNRAAGVPATRGDLSLYEGGQHSLFARSAARPSDLLCLDASTGALVTRVADVTGLFATLDGRAFVDRGAGLQPLDLGRCKG